MEILKSIAQNFEGPWMDPGFQKQVRAIRAYLQLIDEGIIPPAIEVICEKLNLKPRPETDKGPVLEVMKNNSQKQLSRKLFASRARLGGVKYYLVLDTNTLQQTLEILKRHPSAHILIVEIDEGMCKKIRTAVDRLTYPDAVITVLRADVYDVIAAGASHMGAVSGAVRWREWGVCLDMWNANLMLRSGLLVKLNRPRVLLATVSRRTNKRSIIAGHRRTVRCTEENQKKGMERVCIELGYRSCKFHTHHNMLYVNMH